MKTNLECNFSFDDLYIAANGKKISKALKTKFQILDQNKINELVLKWAKKAKWTTEERTGSDKVIYISFHP